MPHMRNHSCTCLCCKRHQIEFQAISIIWNLNKYSHEAAAFKVRFIEVRAATATATSCGSKSSRSQSQRLSKLSYESLWMTQKFWQPCLPTAATTMRHESCIVTGCQADICVCALRGARDSWAVAQRQLAGNSPHKSSMYIVY